MSREYLESFKILYNNIDHLTTDVIIENDEANDCLKTIKKQLPTIEEALQRLEGIDNAKASEALGKLGILASEMGTSIDIKFSNTRFPKMLLAIAQALTKDQELEKQLGCPLKVRCEVIPNSYIYTFGTSMMSEEPIYNVSVSTRRKVITIDKEGFTISYSTVTGREREMTLPWSAYKKTWWLKEDKSE